jgi:hypothetical protein
LALAWSGPTVAPAQDAPAAPRIDLRPDWQSGQTARYEFWNQFDKQTRLDFAGRSQTQQELTQVTGELTWQVESVAADGSARCRMTLDWMKVATTVRTPNGRTAEQTIDSRKGATDEQTRPMHDLLQAMAGVTLHVKVGPDGRIVEVTGRDAMARKTDNPDFLPSDLDFIESASDLATLPFAPAPPGSAPGSDPGQGPGLPLGTTWTADFTWDHELGEVDQDWTFKLESTEQIAGLPVAVVTGTADLDLKPELPDVPAGGPRVSIRMTRGKSTTRVLFDLLRHEAIGRHATNSEQIQVSATMPNGRTLERTITEDVTSQTLRIAEE